ncbi:MAG TPA: transglutaminaseTgpA domain-containing protein [Mycobacteriales bacterium]|nr:transglutaminaseTgpA domain-containing protein [Mycobacteriales bacterium]
MRPSARLTALAGGATALGIVPLAALFDNVTWIFPALAAITLVTSFQLLARRLRLPDGLVPLAGAVGLLLFLSWAFARSGSYGGLLPTWHTLGLLRDGLRDGFADIHDYAVPAPTTTGLTLVVAVSAGLVALLVDALAVAARRPAIAGLVLLALYAVPTAISGRPVSWVYFVAGASGYLMLLLAEERDRLRHWGRPVRATDPGWQGDPAPRHGGWRTSLAVLAIAVVVPAMVPGLSASGLSGFGSGSGGSNGTRLDPYARTRGYLLQGGTPYEVMRLRTDNREAYYLRTQVLDRYSDAGWAMSGPRGSLLTDGALPRPGLGDVRQFSAHVTVTVYDDGYLPTLGGTAKLDGLAEPGQWRYDAERGVVFSETANAKGKDYELWVAEPRPSVAALELSLALGPTEPLEVRWTAVPRNFPAPVRQLVERLAGGAATPYAKARAVYDYFSPANGFQYSTATKPSDTGSDLADFVLRSKQGFCQQYAASLAIMLRVAGVPARVVLGFTHHGEARDGVWSIMNTDAHAWVEAYFAGIGWIPFDSTPPDPGTPGRTVGSGWAPVAAPSARPPASPGASASGTPSTGATRPQRPDAGANAADPVGAGRPSVTPAQVLGLLGTLLAVLLLATPAGCRAVLRRRRIALAGQADPGAAARAAWDELTATAADLDIPLRPEESPRATASRLVREVPLAGPPAAGLRLLALAEERARYAPRPSVDGDLPTAVGAVRRGLRASRGPGRRWLARVAPPSVLHALQAALAQHGTRLSRRVDQLGSDVRRVVRRRRTDPPRRP